MWIQSARPVSDSDRGIDEFADVVCVPRADTPTRLPAHIAGQGVRVGEAGFGRANLLGPRRPEQICRQSRVVRVVQPTSIGGGSGVGAFSLAANLSTFNAPQKGRNAAKPLIL